MLYRQRHLNGVDFSTNLNPSSSYNRMMRRFCFHLLLLSIVVSLAITGLGAGKGMLAICYGANGRVVLEQKCSAVFCPNKGRCVLPCSSQVLGVQNGPSCRDVNVLIELQFTPLSDIPVPHFAELLFGRIVNNATPIVFQSRLASHFLPHMHAAYGIDSVILVI